MSLSLKCQYAVRAMFELAKREGNGLVRLREIAEIQCIPERFLENIMNELRRGGLVLSKRGKDGGFRLDRPAEEISVGDVVRFIETSVHPVDCSNERSCPLEGSCVFMDMWDEVEVAVEKIFDSKSLADLVKYDADCRACLSREVPSHPMEADDDPPIAG